MTTPENVIPETELARRRRVQQLCDDLLDLSHDMVERAVELTSLGVTSIEWVPMVTRSIQDPSLRNRLDNPAMHVLVQSIADIAVTFQVHGVEQADLLMGDLHRKFEALFVARAALDGIGEDERKIIVSIPGGVTVSDVTPDDEHPDSVYDSFSAARMRRMIDRLFAEAPRLAGADSQAPALECSIVLRAGASMMGALSTTPEGTLRLLSPNEMKGKQVMVEHFFDYGEVADIAIIRDVSSRITRPS